MKPLQWNIVLFALSAVFFATLLFGWPGTLAEAGSFATLVAAILTPGSLFLLVTTMDRQEASQAKAAKDGFRALQVQALIALIEDDREKIASMVEDYRATDRKSDKFDGVRRRRDARVRKLNELLKRDLELPEVADESMPA